MSDQIKRCFRRDVLRTTGAAMAVGSVATTASAEDSPEDFEFDAVINVLDEGADPSGEEPIDPILEEHLTDGTLLHFPEGRYKLNQYRNFDGEFGEFDNALYNPLENVGLRGEGSDKVTLVPREGMGSDDLGTGYFHRLWFETRYGRNHLVEGFTFDFTAENTGGRFQLVPDGDFVMRDVHVEGANDNPIGNLLFWTLEADAHGLVEDVRMPDGGENPHGGVAGPGGIFVSSLSQGTITFKHCRVEGFQDNGLYASQPNAPAQIHVIGGYYANNNITQVRLGQPGSLARNVRVDVTERIETDYATNMRGIRVSDGGGVSIENCDIRCTADTPANGAINVEFFGTDATVKNTRILVDEPFNNAAIQASSPPDGIDGSITLENVHITGTATGGPVINLADRADNELRNVCLDVSGADRDGIQFVRSDGIVQESHIDVDGEPIVAVDSDVTTRNLRDDGECARPVRQDR